MKKYIFLLTISVALCMTVAAQNQLSIDRNGSNFVFALDGGDTISDNSTTLGKVIHVGSKPAVQLYSIQVTVDSISGTPTESWVLAGSLDNANWTAISTVSWTGTDGDTTFYYTDISTGVLWPFLRVMGTESGTAKAQLTELVGRFVDEVR